MVSCRVVMAVLFGIGFVGCSAGSQSGLDPSAGGAAVQPSGQRVHRAVVTLTWETGTLDVAPDGGWIQEHRCTSGTVVNGAWSKYPLKDNDDLTVEEQFPNNSASGSAWWYVIKNTANHQESLTYYVLCATQS